MEIHSMKFSNCRGYGIDLINFFLIIFPSFPENDISDTAIDHLTEFEIGSS